MKTNDVKKVFFNNYEMCNKALAIISDVGIRENMSNRISQIVLMYSELFNISITESVIEIDDAVSLESVQKENLK